MVLYISQMFIRRPITTNAGVYIFRRRQIPLYIGKAANLKQRLASYFRSSAQLPLKIQKMLQETTRLEIIETPSEAEALIKEAELIKKYHPKYNILMRDDKSYFYVGITQEEFPRIFVSHQPRASTNSESVTNKRIRTFEKDSLFVDERRRIEARAPRFIGPFTSGAALKTVLKLLRRVFPYCTCKQPHKRPCLNSQIGRCPGYCCTTEMQSAKRKAQMARREYRKNIKNIVAVLSGKRTRLSAHLKKQMKEAVKRERFEQAARLRDQIFGLEDVFQHRQLLTEPQARYSWTAVEPMLRALLRTERNIERIEGYDISNIGGTEATGSMVAFTRGAPDKNQYRKFRIKTVIGISDVGMLKEVFTRRFQHSEWPFPQLLVIDGGKPQLNAAVSVIRSLSPNTYHLTPPLVTALAKREEILHTEDSRAIPLRKQDQAILHLFQRIRDESHRFARKYHHKLREKLFAEKKEGA